MSPALARRLNALALLGLAAVLLGAYGMQFVGGELPCPLCLLQRLGMLGIGLGAMLNLRFGIRPRHYGICLVSAVFGASVSTRQILLHIVPGTGGYGEPFLGYHLYTWALVVFVVTALLMGIMLLLDGQFESENAVRFPRPMRGIERFAFFLMLTIASANIVTTLLECGLEECPDNPTRYELLSDGPAAPAGQ